MLGLGHSTEELLTWILSGRNAWNQGFPPQQRYLSGVQVRADRMGTNFQVGPNNLDWVR